MTAEYRILKEDEVNLALFDAFDRKQEVTRCWRKLGGEWVVKDVPFVDDWSSEKYREQVRYLRELIHSGGYAVGAFCGGKLKGFASVEPVPFGVHAAYLNLSNLHVSRERRRQGIGAGLFVLAKEWAREQHADKLYISAHSSVESQAFYRAMGCVEAVEVNRELAEEEPFDCQMECVLTESVAQGAVPGADERELRDAGDKERKE